MELFHMNAPSFPHLKKQGSGLTRSANQLQAQHPPLQQVGSFLRRNSGCRDLGLAAQGTQRGFPATTPKPNSPSGSAVHALDGIPDLDASVLSPRATEPDKAEAEMGLCDWGLHRLAWFCPGRNTPFLTFLDNGLVQEAHSWLIQGLQVGEGGDKGAGDIVSCGFPGPCRSLSCLFPDTRYHRQSFT